MIYLLIVEFCFCSMIIMKSLINVCFDFEENHDNFKIYKKLQSQNDHYRRSLVCQQSVPS